MKPLTINGLFVDNKGNLCYGRIFYGRPVSGIFGIQPETILKKVKP